MFYAAHNTHADINNGNRGFLNTWEVSRFSTKTERDAFVSKFENKNARACTRKEAVDFWRGQFLSVGKDIPRGGLFADSNEKTERYNSNFWNETYGNMDWDAA